jgi:ATP-dependent helicase/nuclease subunit A
MNNPTLKKDDQIRFPEVTLLRASAGSGKTHALTLRYVQFLLSGRIPFNDLRNILAITFSNNAARDMKTRILKWLKKAHLGDDRSLKDLGTVLSINRSEIRKRSGELVEYILDNYSDLEVRTIDSFMASVFKSSALEFGYDPDVEIILDNTEILEYAFSIFLRKVREGSPESALFEAASNLISRTGKASSRYQWDPTITIDAKMKALYGKLSSLPGDVRVDDYSEKMDTLLHEMKAVTEEIFDLIGESGLERMQSCSFNKVVEALRLNNVTDILGEEFKRLPVKKSDKSTYDRYAPMFEEKQSRLRSLLGLYAEHYARMFYTPYVDLLRGIEHIITDTKRQQRNIFIDDIGRMLARHLEQDIVPEIYLMLGTMIYHYLIDEFQDTSPIQWTSLKPLIENALAQEGSLFVVGDTKQAIYGFRGADYKIMKKMEDDPEFPSAPQAVLDLSTNYRSYERILRFNEITFDAILQHERFSEAARLSGLDLHRQNVREGYEQQGYVEAVKFEYQKGSADTPWKSKIIEIIRDAVERGYEYRDIALLTFKNDRIEEVSSWLSETEIPFLSFSNLDVRKRKITAEITSLLRFLNSPIDDLSFASFLLGDIMEKTLTKSGITRDRIAQSIAVARNRSGGPLSPLYKTFAEEYPTVWQSNFDHLFSRTGYLPLYDLTTEIFKTFYLFERFPREEAALSRILEAAKNFEETGSNSISDFISFADIDSEASEWDIETPKDVNAVQLMTIHKSKGLGFRVVIVLVYGGRPRPEDYIVAEEEGEIRILRISTSLAGASPVLSEIKNRQIAADTADHLNSLYVALTRAKEEMYVLGIEGYHGNDIVELLPYDMFPPGNKPAVVTSTKDLDRHLEPVHISERASNELITGTEKPEEDLFKPAESYRGEIIHNILASLKFTTDPVSEISDPDRFINDDEKVQKNLLHFLRLPEVKELFAPRDGRMVYTEYELSDEHGRLFRADRIIIDPDTITVIDFKTGGERSKYSEQVKKYVSIIRDIYPDVQINGIIAYIDLAKTVTVE